MRWGLLWTGAVCAAATLGQAGDLYNAGGFEGYALGNLPGQDGWVDDTTTPAYGMVQVVNDPTGLGRGKVIALDPPGMGGGWLGAWRPAGPSTLPVVLIEWDQYRSGLSDNFWVADSVQFNGWWAIQWDVVTQASAYYYNFGAPLSAYVWQHVRYTINTALGTAKVEVAGVGSAPVAQPDTAINGIDLEVEPTELGGPDGPLYLDNLWLTEAAAEPSVLLSCAGSPTGDSYDRGFYVVQYPGVSLNSARLELSADIAGSYALTLTVRSNTYDGPVLGTSTATATLASSITPNQPVTFFFPSTPIVKDSRVCFILSVISGPGTGVHYAVPTSGGCTEVVQTEGTTPPLDTFRRYGVGLTLTGVDAPDSDLRLSIARQPAGLYLSWNSTAGRTYTLQTGSSVQALSALQTGIAATPPTNTFGPIVPSAGNRQFYRLMLEPLPAP